MCIAPSFFRQVIVMPLPYQNASSGANARAEIVKILRRFGCESVGFMDEFDTGVVILAFKWRGRQIQLQASGQGWASAYLKEFPYNNKRRGTQKQYEQKALAQGMMAVNSILRDWVKGQVTAIETGILSFEHVFMPYILMPDGRQLIEHITDKKLLPPPPETD